MYMYMHYIILYISMFIMWEDKFFFAGFAVFYFVVSFVTHKEWVMKSEQAKRTS